MPPENDHDKLTQHLAEAKALKRRIEKVEKELDITKNLVISVNELAINMKHMCEEQTKQGEILNHQSERIEKLEKEPLDEAKYYKRQIIGCIITGVVGAVIGAIIGLII